MLFFALSTSALATPPALGPHLVSRRDIDFVDPSFGQGRVDVRLYYPAVDTVTGADPVAGPFPLVAMMHGWLGQAWMYDGACEVLASHGFVVASTDTETGLFLDIETFAWDTVASLHYLEAGSQTQGSWLQGLISDDPWSAMGHSMGGATLARLVDAEPRVEQIVAFMPYVGEGGDEARLAAFPGAALYLAGTHDTTAPPSMTADWFDAFGGRRGLSLLIGGAGHQAVTDDTWGTITPMPHEQQNTITHDLAAAFLLAEVYGEEERYRDLIGPGAPDVFEQISSKSPAPALWAELIGDELSLGVSGEPADVATVWIGSGPSDATDPSLGLIDAEAVAEDEAMIDGVLELSATIPADWSRDLWVQVELQRGASTRAIWLRDGVEETTPGTDPGTDTTPDPGTDTAPDPGTDPGTDPVEEGAVDKGCSQVPGSPAPLLGLVGLLLLRTRR